MQNQQMSLFAEPSDAIDGAIVKLTNGRRRTPNFITHASTLGTLMTTRPSGSLIIAATPNGFATDQVCASLEEYLEEAKSKGYGPGKAGLAVLEIPYSINRRMLQRQIPEIYTALPAGKIGHIHKPQFMLDFSPGYVQPSPLQQVCGLLRARTVDYYLVSKGHYLCPSGSSVADGINQVRFFIQLAAQSKRTHVLFTNPSTAREWLGSGEITNEVTACWLKPYNRVDAKSFAEFKAILKGYDLAIPPRASGFTLLSHAKEIWDAVWGCTYRLNKWAINTLVSVRARGGDQVTWDDFCQCAPSDTEVKQAKQEFDDIKAMSSSFPATPLNTDNRRSGRGGKDIPKPGQRSLGRDEVGQDANEAA